MAAKLFRPGAMFKVPAGGDEFAFAVMLSVESYVAFYGKDVITDESGLPVDAPMFVLPVERSAYTAGKWGPVIRMVPEEAVPAVPKFFWQNVGNKWDCRIFDPVNRRKIVATPQECVGLEREASWAQAHIEARIADTYAGRPNAFAESLRPKL